MTTTTVTLPRKHAADWLARYDGTDATQVASSARTITLTLSASALDDLRSDASHYATAMEPEATGDVDYRPAARRCLDALARLTPPAPVPPAELARTMARVTGSSAATVRYERRMPDGTLTVEAEGTH